MKLTRWLTDFVLTAILAAHVCTLRAEEPSPSPSPASSDAEEDTTKEVSSPSPDGRFAFLFSRGEYEQSIDLVDAKTEKILQHIADHDFSSVSYSVLWAPDSKRFALMTRMGHPNQGVDVYLRNGNKFQEIKLPELTVEIPKKILAGKEHPHVVMNHWQQAEKWNKDGSLLLTIDNMVDGASHTARALRTVLLGFDRYGNAKIHNSTVKYESRNSDEE